MKKKSTKTKKNIRLIHKWLGLILGVQVLFWVSGGVVMSIFPLEMVRGSDRVVEKKAADLNPASYLIPVSQIIHTYPESKKIIADNWMGRAVYSVQLEQKSLLIDANTGDSISPISSTTAVEIALSDYSEKTTVLAVNEITHAQGEVRGRQGELWQVILDDDRNTRIYV